MANIQSDEFLKPTTLTDTRKQIPLSGEEQMAQSFKQLLYVPPITTVGEETVLNWQTMPGTRKILFDTKINALDAGDVIYEFILNYDYCQNNFVQVRDVFNNYQFADYGLQLEIELLGNPLVQGELTSWFWPGQVRCPYTLNIPTDLAAMVKDTKAISFCKHLEIVTMKNGRLRWMFPFCKPFYYFLNNTSGPHNYTQLYDLGQFMFAALTPVRTRSTEASSISIKIWGSLIVNYGGSKFQSEQP